MHLLILNWKKNYSPRATNAWRSITVLKFCFSILLWHCTPLNLILSVLWFSFCRSSWPVSSNKSGAINVRIFNINFLKIIVDVTLFNYNSKRAKKDNCTRHTWETFCKLFSTDCFLKIKKRENFSAAFDFQLNLILSVRKSECIERCEPFM